MIKSAAVNVKVLKKKTSFNVISNGLTLTVLVWFDQLSLTVAT